jgi:hypothetical protein
MVTLEEIDSWAREAGKRNVRVTYRVAGQQIPTTRTMAHEEYIRWVGQLSANGYELVRAEQVRKE